MNTPVHRHSDSRSCGATTTVMGQGTVWVNNKLASVQGDGNTHGGGALSASVNDGTVWINNKKVVLKGSGSAPDYLCRPKGPPHCSPSATSGSGDVYACGGAAGGGGGPGIVDEGPDPTRSELYPDPNATPQEDIRDDFQDPGGEDSYDPTEFSEQDQARITALENDPEWQRELALIEERFPGFDRTELYKIINGESNFDPKARNPSGATGLFQIMPDSAKTIGTTTTAISQQTPAQQLNTYGKHLDFWKYDPDNSLGMMQAAPAYASRSGSSVVYPVGSAAWNQNPGWRDPRGPITVDSINNYYRNS